jgi:DDE domain
VAKLRHGHTASRHEILERGVEVTYEAIRKWCHKFGQPYANQLRRRRPRPGDKWHLDEMVLAIKGVHQYLWRAVDQDGNVLDILVQRRRDKKAAKKFFRVVYLWPADKLPARKPRGIPTFGPIGGGTKWCTTCFSMSFW